MKIAIGCDHGGYPLKDGIVAQLKSLGHEVVDVGAFTFDAKDDYPDFAQGVARAVQEKKAEKGIILYGSGVGACITANKLKGVRACLCHDTYSAAQGVAHDDMNVLCLGGRVVGVELAVVLIQAFLGAEYQGNKAGGERLARRVGKIHKIENNETIV